MRWLLSLLLGLIFAWIIVSNVNKMPRVSYYQADTIPGEISKVDDSLVAVGLAQFPEVPSIMDSINKPVQYTGQHTVVQGSLPDPNFTPLPGQMTPGPAASRPMSSPGSSISSSAGFATPAPAPGPAASSPAPTASSPAPFAASSPSGSPYPSS